MHLHGHLLNTKVYIALRAGCCRCFPNMNSFNPCNNLKRQVLSSPPFYRRDYVTCSSPQNSRTWVLTHFCATLPLTSWGLLLCAEYFGEILPVYWLILCSPPPCDTDAAVTLILQRRPLRYSTVSDIAGVTQQGGSRAGTRIQVHRPTLVHFRLYCSLGTE